MNALARFGLLLLLGIGPALAEGLMMARSPLMFPEAMAVLQRAIRDQGYTITRLQEVNENLSKRDYSSDVYRVVFFGKHEEIRAMVAGNPELVPFLPLNVTIFAEGDNAIVMAAHPRTLEAFFPDPGLKPVFERWEADLAKIMNAVRESR